jgi:uncharacterized protein YegL
MIKANTDQLNQAMSHSNAFHIGNEVEVFVRDKHFIFLIDTSHSMDADLDAVNQAIKDILPLLKTWENDQKGNSQISLQVITFGGDVNYVVGSNGIFVPLEQVQIPELSASGGTPMCEAIQESISSLTSAYDAGKKYSKPVVLLLSDGEPTDGDDLPIDAFSSSKLGQGASRIAVAFSDAANKQILESFLSRDMKEVGLFQASNATELVQQLKNAALSAVVGHNVNVNAAADLKA